MIWRDMPAQVSKKISSYQFVNSWKQPYILTLAEEIFPADRKETQGHCSPENHLFNCWVHPNLGFLTDLSNMALALEDRSVGSLRLEQEELESVCEKHKCPRNKDYRESNKYSLSTVPQLALIAARFGNL